MIKISPECTTVQSREGTYDKGMNLTIGFRCGSLSRGLLQGDRIWVMAFMDEDNPDNWLAYYIPINGYSSITLDNSK